MNILFFNKSKYLLVLLMGIMLVISACGSNNASTQQNDARNNSQQNNQQAEGTDNQSDEEKNPIKIGVIIPITGYAALAGESAKRAVELHVELVNAEGGIEGQLIDIEIADSEGKPEVAARVAETMINDGVVAISGPYLTPTSFAVEPVITEAKVPMISMSGGFQPRGDGHPFSWTVTAGAGPAIEKVINHMIDTNLGKIATITPTDALGASGDEGLKHFLEGKYKGQLEWVGHEKFNLNDVDITAQLSKLKAQAPDLVFVGASGESIVTIRKQMNQVGMEDVPLATYHSNTTREMINLIGNTPGTMLFPATAANIANDLPDGELKENALAFSNDYEQKYGEPPMTTEGIAFDSIGVIFEAIRAVGSDRDKISEWLNAGQTITGANQVYEYKADDHVGGDYTDLFMVEAEQGQWKRIN